MATEPSALVEQDVLWPDQNQQPDSGMQEGLDTLGYSPCVATSQTALAG